MYSGHLFLPLGSAHLLEHIITSYVCCCTVDVTVYLCTVFPVPNTSPLQNARGCELKLPKLWTWQRAKMPTLCARIHHQRPKWTAQWLHTSGLSARFISDSKSNARLQAPQRAGWKMKHAWQTIDDWAITDGQRQCWPPFLSNVCIPVKPCKTIAQHPPR